MMWVSETHDRPVYLLLCAGVVDGGDDGVCWWLEDVNLQICRPGVAAVTAAASAAHLNDVLEPPPT